MAIKCEKCGAPKSAFVRYSHITKGEKSEMISCLICGALYIEGVQKRIIEDNPFKTKIDEDKLAACTACGHKSVLKNASKSGLCSVCSKRLSAWKSNKRAGYNAYNPFIWIDNKWVFKKGESRDGKGTRKKNVNSQ